MDQFIFWFGTIVFIGTYIAIASEKIHKTVAALLGASLMMVVILGNYHVVGDATDAAVRFSKLDLFSKYSNFDVIFTLAGMMLLVNILSGTGLFQYVAIKCAKIAKGSPVRTLILLVFATAIMSAFLDNVTTILLVAPVTLVVCSQLGVPVMPFLMAETMASNIGGTATLIGDPPNLIIGNIANLSFSAFLINLAPFILAILAIYCIALWVYYGKKMQVSIEKRALVMDMNEKAAITNPENMKRGGIIMLLTIVGFLLHSFVHLQPSVVAVTGAAFALLFCKVDVDHSLEKIEWSTLGFFMALFILVSGAQACGLMAEIGSWLNLFGNAHILVIVLTIMWISAIASAIMNNVSFTAAMAAIVAEFVKSHEAFKPLDGKMTPEAELLWWGLALAVCLGGNGTIVGAAANLVTAGIAEKAGAKITFKEFIRYGLPVTFFSMVAASIYIIIRYYLCCR